MSVACRSLSEGVEGLRSKWYPPMDDRPTCLTGKTVAVTGETVAVTGKTVAVTGETVAVTGKTVAVTGETLPAFAGVVANAGSDVDAICFFR